LITLVAKAFELYFGLEVSAPLRRRRSAHLPCQHAARSHASTACEGGADVLQAYEHAHELYRASPRWCLDWRYRGARLLAEIAALRPDIGCLQEVDQLPQFQAHLTALGCAPPPSPGLAGCGLHTAALAFNAVGCQSELTPAVSAEHVL